MGWHAQPEYLEKGDPGPLRRLSLKCARDIISRGGSIMGREVISKDNYAMGWVTSQQREILEKETSSSVVHLTEDDFHGLTEYSTSLPTSPSIGRRWKRRIPVNGPLKHWLLGETYDIGSRTEVGIRWSIIEVKS